MKKFTSIIFLFFFILTSCKKDFLQLAPKDSFTDASYFKTPGQFNQAVLGAYAPLRDVALNDFLTSEMHSDNTIYQPYPNNRGTATVERENISDFRTTPVNAYVENVWRFSYNGIARANVIIGRLATTDIILPDSVRNSIDGQAKFIRALNYFKLVRLFGGVPLNLKETTTADETFIARATEAEVYSQIIADAKEAVDKLSAPVRFPQSGAATKGSATVLLADVYINQKRWAEAEALLTTLPAMGYGLNANYADAFLPATGRKNGIESLFDIQYLEGLATTTGTTPNPLGVLYFLPRSTNTTVVAGVAADNNANGGVNTPTQDLISTYEPNDKRLDASIGIAEGTYNASWLFTYSANKSVLNYTPAAGKIGIPYIKKYIHAPLAFPNGSSDNWPVYRYSEALLLLAEALNEQGKSPLTPLNAVRTRAGLAPATAASQATLRDVILHERRVELAFENKRWHDLARTGKAIAVINAFGIKLKSEAFYAPYLLPDAYVIDAHHLLFPIPQTDIGLNTKLVQNPGY
jgi:hypothetical protein